MLRFEVKKEDRAGRYEIEGQKFMRGEFLRLLNLEIEIETDRVVECNKMLTLIREFRDSAINRLSLLRPVQGNSIINLEVDKVVARHRVLQLDIEARREGLHSRLLDLMSMKNQ